MFLLAALLVLQVEAGPEYVLKDYRLPADLPVTQEQVLKWFVPDYERKRARPQTVFDQYEAAVLYSRRTNLGVSGEDLLVVAILEIDSPCEMCRHAAFGIVDLKRRRPVGGWYNPEPSFIDSESLSLSKRGAPWAVSFVSGCCPRRDMPEGIEWRRTAHFKRVPNEGLVATLTPVTEARMPRPQG